MEKIYTQFKFWVPVFFLKKTSHRTSVLENKMRGLELFSSFCILCSNLPLYLVNLCL